VGRVVIGMDPHKRSATIEVINEREQVLAQGRYGTDSAGYQAMLAAGRRFSDRVWAVQGCAAIGRHIAQRLVADGETVLDVPAKLSARVRVFDTGQGRKTDPVDAHSVAVAGLRSPGLPAVAADDATVVLRLLVDRRDELGRAHTDIVSRIHHLLLELIPRWGEEVPHPRPGQLPAAHRPSTGGHRRPDPPRPRPRTHRGPSSTRRSGRRTSSSASSSPRRAAR
jgi:transposase